MPQMVPLAKNCVWLCHGRNEDLQPVNFLPRRKVCHNSSLWVSPAWIHNSLVAPGCGQNDDFWPETGNCSATDDSFGSSDPWIAKRWGLAGMVPCEFWSLGGHPSCRPGGGVHLRHAKTVNDDLQRGSKDPYLWGPMDREPTSLRWRPGAGTGVHFGDRVGWVCVSGCV